MRVAFQDLKGFYVAVISSFVLCGCGESSTSEFEFLDPDIIGDSTIENDYADNDSLETHVGRDCERCLQTEDCAQGFECARIGDSYHCLRSCDSSSDCPLYAKCDDVLARGGLCFPWTGVCSQCWEPDFCQRGQACDSSRGECLPWDPCQRCRKDADCGEGRRCSLEFLTCLPECDDGSPCPESDYQDCGTNPHDPNLCIVDPVIHCGGCNDVTHPFLSPNGRECWECYADGDCEDGSICDSTKGNCVVSEG